MSAICFRATSPASRRLSHLAPRGRSCTILVARATYRVAPPQSPRAVAPIELVLALRMAWDASTRSHHASVYQDQRADEALASAIARCRRIELEPLRPVPTQLEEIIEVLEPDCLELVG